MKNLILKNSKVLFNNSNITECILYAWHNDFNFYFANGSKVFAYNANEEIIIYDLKNDILTESDGQIVDLKVISDQFKLFIAMSTGEIFFTDYNIEKLELMGQISKGIIATAWSPDLELCVILSIDSNISLMTADMDILSEINLYEIQKPQCDHISVGWGSKGTQFHGSDGKKAAIQSNQVVPKVLSFDDLKVEITWRDDGQYFLIGYVDQIKTSRQFKIFSREGILHSSSNCDDILGQAICFGPNNNLLTTCKYKENNAEICFYEMNSLPHLQFTLPFMNINVKRVKFNNNNSILAIYIATLSDTTSNKVLVYTTSNYHWYLKQCLDFEREGVVGIIWDECIRNRLNICTTRGRVLVYDWLQKYSPINTTSAMAAVIDANDLMITPLNVVVIPPPMCSYRIRLQCPVIAVSWKHQKSLAVNQNMHEALISDANKDAVTDAEDIFILTSDNLIHHFSYSHDSIDSTSEIVSVFYDNPQNLGFKNICPLPTFIASFKFVNELNIFPLSIKHLTFVSDLTIVFAFFDDHEYLFIANLNKENLSIDIVWKINLIKSINSICPYTNYDKIIDDNVLVIDILNDSQYLAIEMKNGDCWQIHIQTGTIEQFKTFNGQALIFPTPCSIIKSILFDDHREGLIGLSETYRLFVNEIEIAQDCSSFAINKEFILWTTNTHNLKSIDKHNFYKTKVLKEGDILEEKRNVERGSRIVCTKNSKVILEMPRGNLEVVHPRVLVLHSLKIHLDKLEYMEGFKLCRRHRINMNLLADHKFETFLSNIKLFVQQLQTIENINLFLAALIKDDVTFTMYKNYYLDKSFSNNWTNKLDDICNQIQNVLLEINMDKYFISIITCDIKKTTPDLEVALKRIKAMKEIDGIRAVEAVKYLFFLRDPMNIYNVALSTYDLQLAVIVAEQSHMDPKEYLPHLNRLGEMEENLMKYSIDLQLKKYEKALESLTKCGENHYEECLKLISEHRLHSKALSLYSNSSKQHKEIAVLYAARLGEDKHYNESAILYYRIGEYQLALSMFENAIIWEMCLCCATQLNYDAKQIALLAKSLSAKLVQNHMHTEAATLLETYADDYEEAVVVLIAGHKWKEALRLIYKYKRMDLIETNFKPSLIDTADNQMDDFKKIIAEFDTHLNRLVVIRNDTNLEKALDRGQLEASNDMMSDTSSVISDNSSHVTSESRQSKTSSKSRKSTNKKKWSLRKGSSNEHIALTEALFNIIQRSQTTILDDLKNLTSTLLLFDKDKLALDLQNQMSSLFETIDKSVDIIWLQSNSVITTSNYTYGPNSTSSSISAACIDKSKRDIQSDNNNLKDLPFMVKPIMKTLTWKNIFINELSIKE